MSSSPHPAEYYTLALRQLVSTAEAAAKLAEVAQLEVPTVQGIAGGGAAAGKREIIERIIRAETERLKEEAENVGREAERAAAETERLRSETERKKVEIEFEKVNDKDLDSSARVAQGWSFKEGAERLQADTEGRKTEKERKLAEIKTVGRKDLTGSARVMRRLPFQEEGGLVAEAQPK